MRDLLFDFGITLGKRKTTKQKQVFIDELEKRLIDKNVSYKIQFNKQAFFSSKHIIVGDINRSKLILIGNYDTPSINLCRRPYHPLMIKENIRTEQINLIISISVFILLNSIFVLSFNYVNNLNLFIKIILFFIEVLLFIFSIKLIDGIANPINQNRNSASIALMIDLISKNSTDISYIFMDSNYGSLIGYKQCKQFLDNDKTKVILDSIASGKELYYASLQKNYFNDVNWIKAEGKYWFNQICNLGILFTGENKNNKYTVDSSRFFNDYKVNQERLKIIQDELLRYIER